VVPKPPGCQGCPAYGRGSYFVPDDNKPDAKVRVVAQNPGEAEEHGRRFVRWYKGEEGTGEIWEQDVPRPMIGKTGYELDHHFLPLARLKREDVEVCNVVRCRLNGSNDLPPLTTTFMRDTITHCQRAHWKEPRESQTMVALGAYALWALTGEYEGDEDDSSDDSRASHSIDGWRGWLVPYKPQHVDGEVRRGRVPMVFTTYHPSYFYRAHWLKAVGKMDWARLGRYLRGEWPEPFPKISDEAPTLLHHTLAYDTEYNPHSRELHRYSLAWRYLDQPAVHVVEARDIRRELGRPKHLVMQNAEADWPYIPHIFVRYPEKWDDTMLAHSALYGTLRHSLDFIGSLYARTNRWKHLQLSDPEAYAGGDALGTYDAWTVLARELDRDGDSRTVYEHELKVQLPILLNRATVNLDAMHIAAAAAELKREQDEVKARGAAVAGWPLSISSPDQVARWLRLKRDD